METTGERARLDGRKADILRAIVREYIRTGMPVGSKTLAGRYKLNVSAATIRNEMGVLEELGYITQPHTSAGRIPTDVGYRWFVDHWPSSHWPKLPEDERRILRSLEYSKFGGIDDALSSTSQVLSEVTEAASVVVAPPASKNLLRRMELLRRGDGRATLLLIADTGVVEQGVVEFGSDVTDDQLDRLASRLNRKLEGVAFEDLANRIVESKWTGLEAADVKAVASEIGRLLSAVGADRIFRGGTSHILSPDKFSDLATAHDVVGALEQPLLLSNLLDAARRAGTMLVFIGQEVPVEQMKACAVVFAPYEAGGSLQGTLGVIGPTRMNYPHTISAVEAAARALSRMLESSER